jgi:hypothetical protein
MDILELCHFRSPSVVTHNLNVKRITTLPYKTDPPLIIDADAVLPCPIGFQALQSVGYCNPQVVQ